MKLRPLGNRVIVKRREASVRTAGGLYKPATADGEPPIEGRILAVADGVEGLEPEDVVLFGRYSGNDVEIDSVELVILDADDVLAVKENGGSDAA